MKTVQSDPLYFLDDDCLAEYERKVIAISRRRIVRHLFGNKISSLSKIIKIANISLNSLAAVFVELNEAGLVDRSEEGMWLTEKGRRWAITNRKQIFMCAQPIRYRSPLIMDEDKIMRNEDETLPKKYIIAD